MELLRNAEGVEVVAPPVLLRRFPRTFTGATRREMVTALLHQSPKWVVPSRIEVVEADWRVLRDRDIPDDPRDGYEMLITARVFERDTLPEAMPLFARFEHWVRGVASGMVLREMWAQGRSARFAVMGVQPSKDDVLEPPMNFETSMRAWEALQAYAEYRENELTFDR